MECPIAPGSTRVARKPALPRFPSQIWVCDVTFVNFLGDKKCDSLNLSHFWEQCDALVHDFFFELLMFFVTSFPKNVTFWPRRYKTFLKGKKCDDSAGTETGLSFTVSNLSLISEA